MKCRIYINIKNSQNRNPKDFQSFQLFYQMFWGHDWDTLVVIKPWCNQPYLYNFSQKYHEEPCKFQLRVSGYFDGEYRKICPWQVIDQKLRRRHHKQF